MNDSRPHGTDASRTRPRSPQSGRWRRTAGVIAVFALLLVGGYFARDYVKQLGPPERCWEIREMDGRLYKMNPCTGQFRLLGDVPAAAPGR